VTDRLFLESVREGDREREAAKGGTVEGVVDREGVALAASCLLKDQRLTAMGAYTIPHYILFYLYIYMYIYIYIYIDTRIPETRDLRIEGVVDREGVALAAAALLKDQRLTAMGIPEFSEF